MKLLITENQCKKLFEARKEGFRLDNITAAKDGDERLLYCRDMLGIPCGYGSSRVVWQLDDDTVLKVAYNDSGIAQNLEEIRIAKSGTLHFVPKILNGTDEKNGLWIVTQYVIPALKRDFGKLLRINFNDIERLVVSVDARCQRDSSFFTAMFAAKTIDEVCRKYERNRGAVALINDLFRLKSEHNQYIGDLSRIENWGMALEKGKPRMVVLDSGFSEEVYNQFYKRR